MSKFILTGFADEAATDFQEQLDVLKKLDISYIEMRNVNGKNLVEYPLKEAKEIKAQLDKADIKLSALGSPVGKYGIKEDFNSHLDLFKHTLDIANIMETSYIRMFSFWMPKDEEPSNYRNAVIDRLGQFVELAKAANITLLHENEKGIYGDIAERCYDLLSTINSDYFKAIFDPANFIQCGEETYPKAWNLLKDYVAYMHIKDAKYEGGKVMPAGHGDGKVQDILKELSKFNISSCFLSLEPHLSVNGDYPKLNPNSPGFNFASEKARLFALACQELRTILNMI